MPPATSPQPRQRKGLRLALLTGAFLLLSWLSHGCLTSPANLECRPCLDNNSCILEAFQCVEGICRPRSTELATCEASNADR